MTEPRAQAAAHYFERLGIRPPRARPRPAIEDDDADIEIGAAQMETPEQATDELDVELGAPRVESREMTVPQIDIVGDPHADEVGNVVAALPAWLSEPASRAMRDPNSVLGSVARRAVTTDLAPLVYGLGYDPARHPRGTVGSALGNEGVEAMQTFGERGGDALPFGFGEEIYSELTGQANLDRMGIRPRTTDDTPVQRRGLDAQQLDETDRARYLRERSERTARNPVASAAGTVAGTLPAAVLTPGPTSGSWIGRVGQAARNNAIVGAVTGTGLAEEGNRIEGGIAGGVAGGVLGGGAQLIGEGVGALGRFLADRGSVGRQALRQVGPVAERYADVAEGPQQADAVRRLLAAEDAAPVQMPEGARAGMFPDDEHVLGAARTVDNPPPSTSRWTDDLPPDPADRVPYDASDTLEAQLRRHNASQEATPRPGARRTATPTEEVLVDDLTEVAPTRAGASAEAAELTGADVLDDTSEEADEFLGAVSPQPRRAAPEMPEQGPALRAAALRGERSFGARGDAARDPSIQFSDELSAMSRDYADIEGGVGGFQPLKDARITAAMEEAPPPAEWAPRSRAALEEMRSRLDAITRHAGADSRMVRSVGEARFALDEAQRMLDAADAFGGARPADVYRMLNRANMGVGRAAAAEARQGGMGMQHTTAFAEPLTESYQRMRSFLMDEGTWGAGARVQREMNATTAPLLRTGRALRDRTGALFQDSGEQAANGGGFRTYETVRPEAVRGILGRVGDDAYESDRQLLRAWIENYGQQGQTLARLSDDPALAPQAQQMQERAGRLLDILDRAEVEGRAAELLRSVASSNMGRINIGTLVRTLSRIEAGELTVPATPGAAQLLGELERQLLQGSRVSGFAQPVASQVMSAAAAREAQQEPEMQPQSTDPYGDVPGVPYELEDEAPAQTPALDPYADVPGTMYEEDDDEHRRR